MEISEVRIKLMDDPHERLQGFCSITFDGCFVIRDLKIIQGTKGSFVAMPSRKLTDRCPQCETKNHLRANHCNNCGAALQEDRALKDDDGRAKLYADIAHPINSHCRDMIQRRVLQAYREELVKAQQPGYRCTYDDYGEDRYATLREPEDVSVRPVIVAGSKDVSHRIEPGTDQPRAPHRIPAPSREAAPALTPSGGSDYGAETDFGAGIA